MGRREAAKIGISLLCPSLLFHGRPSSLHSSLLIQCSLMFLDCLNGCFGPSSRSPCGDVRNAEYIKGWAAARLGKTIFTGSSPFPRRSWICLLPQTTLCRLRSNLCVSQTAILGILRIVPSKPIEHEAKVHIGFVHVSGGQHTFVAVGPADLQCDNSTKHHAAEGLLSLRTEGLIQFRRINAIQPDFYSRATGG